MERIVNMISSEEDELFQYRYSNWVFFYQRINSTPSLYYKVYIV